MGSETKPLFMQELTEQAVMVAVKNGMRASVSPEARHLVDKVTKVEMKTTAMPHTLTMQVSLAIWWDLGDGEFHVTERKAVVEDGAFTSHEEILQELTTFKPEEILKFAAFV